VLKIVFLNIAANFFANFASILLVSNIASSTSADLHPSLLSYYYYYYYCVFWQMQLLRFSYFSIFNYYIDVL